MTPVRSNDEVIGERPALYWPASKKRQDTKSRDVGHRLSLIAAMSLIQIYWDPCGRTRFFTIETAEGSSSNYIRMLLTSGFSSRSWRGVDTTASAHQMRVSALLPRRETRDLARCRASGRRNERKATIQRWPSQPLIHLHEYVACAASGSVGGS